MHDLVVDSHLHALIVDDENADAAPAIVERVSQALEEVALVKDREALLDIASLGHGNDAAILADVENTVLLEDRTKHVLDDDRRRRVGDEAGLLMELLGEEVNTEVAVLAGLGGGGDADDLARAALEDQEVTNADVVAGDSDGVGGSHVAGFDDANFLDGNTGRNGADGRSSGSRGGGGVLLLDYDLLAAVVVLGSGVGVVVRVVVAVTVDGVNDVIGDLVGSLGDTVTERVVVTVFVVISHITLVLLGGVNRGSSSLLYSNLFSRRVAAVDDVNLPPLVGGSVVLGGEGLLAVAGGLLVVGTGAEVGVTLLSSVTTYDGTGVFAVLTLRDVNLGGSVVGGRALDSVEVPVVGLALDFDVAPDVGAVGLLVAVMRKEKVSLGREEKRREKWVACVARTTIKRIGLGDRWLLRPMHRGRGADSCRHNKT